MEGEIALALVYRLTAAIVILMNNPGKLVP